MSLRSVGSADQGNASIAVVGGVAMVMVFLLGLSDLAAFYLARTRAQTAADSASLAAAAELIPGLGTDPEGKAQEFAAANGARLIDCRCAQGSTVAELSVAVPVALTLPAFSDVREVKARSRAEVTAPASVP